MEKEIKITSAELEPLADMVSQTFIQRWDMYPRQNDDGSYICMHKALTQNHILAHLRGMITLGTYLLDVENQARFIVFDADTDEQMVGLTQMAQSLDHHRIPASLESSRRGGHLWLFFEDSIPGKDARIFGNGLMAAHNLPEGIELYPKQDVLGEGPGSLIRLPFGVHRQDGKRYGFITAFGQPVTNRLRDQIPLFFEPQTVSEAAFDDFCQLGQEQGQKTAEIPAEPAREQLSDTLKNAITVFDFVSQYVELAPNGRGHCPFHDDQRKSFSVNIEENYWHCFSGCGGGSIIDFWMKRQDCEFKTALRELAEMLL